MCSTPGFQLNMQPSRSIRNTAASVSFEIKLPNKRVWCGKGSCGQVSDTTTLLCPVFSILTHRATSKKCGDKKYYSHLFYIRVRKSAKRFGIVDLISGIRLTRPRTFSSIRQSHSRSLRVLVPIAHPKLIVD